MKKFSKLIVILLVMFLCNKVRAFEKYNIGEEVLYKNEEYYVIENSDENKNYVTLLKDKSLTVDEVNKYGRDDDKKLFVNKYVINTNNPEDVIFNFKDGS